MKIRSAIFFLIVFQLAFVNVKSQYNLLPDSVKQRLDTMKAKRVDRYLIGKAWAIMSNNPAGAMTYAKAHYEKGIALKDSVLIANSYVTKGTIYQLVGDFPKSITELIKAVKIYTALKDNPRLAIALNNLGNTYRYTKDYDQAIACQERALKIRIEGKDSAKIRTSYLNIATVLFSKKDFESARAFTQKALGFNTKNKNEIITTYMNYAGIFVELKRFDSALYYADKMHSLIVNDTAHLGEYNIILGGICLAKKNIPKAEYYYLLGVKLFEAAGETYRIQAVQENLYDLYKQKGDFKEALKYYEIAASQKDSANSQAKNLQVAFLNAEFDVNQKEAEIKNLKQKSVLDEEEKSKIRIVRNSVIGGIVLILLLGLVSYRRSIERKKMSNEIVQKNKDITDSIQYAKRLQEAVFPQMDLLNKYFADSFILFKPKDIVSGDFYWFEQTGDKTILAVGDCTGHGVPGAFMSILGHNLLNQIILEYGITNPAEILRMLDKNISNALNKKGTKNEYNDGMDIAICAIDKKEKTLVFAGANRPLIIKRDNELIELKPNKFAIGGIQDDTCKLFGQQKMEAKPGDIFYLFSDGYYDQFGGPDGKKFKYRRLVEHFKSIGNLELNEQKRSLENTLENWKGDLEQLDDVCVVGVKI